MPTASAGGFSVLFDLLDPEDKKRGDQFETICRWFLSNDPRYRDQFRKVWLWDEWPKRWGRDRGTDLIAERHDGSLWAIQAKAYDPRYYVKKSDLDSFLSDSNRPQIDYRLLIATTNLIGRGALSTLEGQEKPVGLILRSDLEKANVIWPTSPDDLRAPKPKRKKPRPHDREAIRAVCGGFEDTDRGQLVMACGTGKTLIGLWSAEALESRRTLVLLPSLSLLAQTLREWTANAKEPFALLPVCSDETVRGEDHMVSHTAELGMPVTTDPAVIAAFLRKRTQPRVVFSTYHSSPQVAAALGEGGVPGFDLVIADEAHRVAGRVSSDFAAVLDGDTIRARRRLFMTATPRYFSGRVRREASQEEFEIASMDDEAKFGPVFHRLSFGEAIERDLLTDYQVVIVGVDDPTYRSYVEDGAFVTTDGKEVTDARTLAAHISLAKAMHDFDLRRTISFHSRIANARAFATEFPDVVAWMPAEDRPVGDLICDHVSGRMSSGQRDDRLDRLRYLNDDERGLLSNARCLGEGVDVPTLDGVAFVDPKGSLIDIIQAVGRAIRKAEDKTVGTILLPVYVGDTSDPEAALENSAFRPVWNVLKALRAHDEKLAEELDALRREIGRRGIGEVRLPGRIHVHLPVSVSDTFSRAFSTRMVEQATASWEFWFGLLNQYIERVGDARVHPRYTTDAGYRLGNWVQAQRRSYVNRTLSRHRLERLESIRGWVWDGMEALWEEGFERLRLYAAEHGTALVENELVLDDAYQLGAWVATQRYFHKRRTLSEDRIERLEALPGWTWDVFTADWEEGFDRLQQYASEHGTTRVPAKLILEDGYKLGSWTRNQRSSYGRGRLSEDRIERLEALPGWTWGVFTADWEEGFERLRQYASNHGTALVHNELVLDDGYQLGAWTRTQRSSYGRGRLIEDRVMRLEHLSGWVWDIQVAVWQEALVALEAFVQREGHARVPRDHREGDVKLGQWVSMQRRRYKAGTIEADRVNRLEVLPEWTWDIKQAAWEERFERLRRYASEHGTTRIAAKAVLDDGFKLGSWVTTQRSTYNKGNLSEDRIQRLEALPGWTWDARQPSES